MSTGDDGSGISAEEIFLSDLKSILIKCGQHFHIAVIAFSGRFL